MKDEIGRGVRLSAAVLGVLGLSALRATAEQPGPIEPAVLNETDDAVKTPETTISDWPLRPRAEARALIEKYGEPDDFDDDTLAWHRNGPWIETVVHRAAPPYFAGLGEKDILEQSIFYDVPDDRVAALKAFDGRLQFDAETGQLTSVAESEGLNYLSLNLAAEIVNNTRSPGAAHEFYRRTIKLAAAGKSSAYMEGFLFPPASAPLR